MNRILEANKELNFGTKIVGGLSNEGKSETAEDGILVFDNLDEILDCIEETDERLIVNVKMEHYA